MKLLTKLFTLIIAIAFLASCSDDDESNTEIQLEDASIAFDAENPPLEIPSGLQDLASSGNENASLINGQLQTINTFIPAYSSFFTIPEGASQSDTPIGSPGGRVAAVGDVVVYTYSASVENNNGETITVTAAYQITEEENDFLFEYFFQFDGGEYFKFIEARESKSELNQGYFKIFFTAYDAEEADESSFTFEWNESATGVKNYSYYDNFASFRADILVNPDNSGELELYREGTIYYSATWIGNGTEGTFTNYDNEGAIINSGTWPQ